MPNEVTMLENLIIPEVMADMISAKLPTKLMFAPLAVIDDTLVGVPGNTITVGRFKYIGDAEDVAEGAKMGVATLEASTTTFTIKKAAKAVSITDESVLSGYGNPAGEAQSQLLKSIASKIDADCASALMDSTLIYDGSAGKIGYSGIVDAIDLFNEEEQSAKVMLIHSKQLTDIRKDPDFLDKNKYGLELMMKGAIGTISGAEVVVSNRVKFEDGVYFNPIVRLTQTDETEVDIPALKIFMKRKPMVEKARDTLRGITTPSVNEHYGVALTNDSKVVVAKFKGATPPIEVLDVESSEGQTAGHTAVTVYPERTSGNSYKMKVAASPTIPAYKATCTTGYTAWDGVAEIEAATGQKIVVVEVDDSNHALKAGIATVTSKA